MKVIIYTFHSVPNYGAVLQTYALSYWLKKNGVNAFISSYIPVALDDFKPKDVENSKKNILKRIYYKIFSEKNYKKKLKKFEAFRKNHLTVVSDLQFPDACICGSDQIWNPELTGEQLDPVYFCKGLETGTKIIKISYAASSGDVSSLGNYSEEFVSLLENLDFIGVREDDLADHIRKISSKLPVTVLDPTLLLKFSDYDNISNRLHYSGRKYLLIYQLGKYKSVRKAAEKAAAEKGLEIIEICSIVRPYEKLKRKMIISWAGPDDFIFYFKNASFVVTNSFHGTCFSLIFQKDFIVVPKEKRNSRITGLLSSIGLDDRISESDGSFDGVYSTDHSKAELKLDNLRTASEDFLKKSLGLD